MMGLLMFEGLSEVEKLVSVPASNAVVERAFSVIGLTKTKARKAFTMDEMLSSVIAVKLADTEPQCFK